MVSDFQSLWRSDFNEIKSKLCLIVDFKIKEHKHCTKGAFSALKYWSSYCYSGFVEKKKEKSIEIQGCPWS